MLDLETRRRFPRAIDDGDDRGGSGLDPRDVFVVSAHRELDRIAGVGRTTVGEHEDARHFTGQATQLRASRLVRPDRWDR